MRPMRAPALLIALQRARNGAYGSPPYRRHATIRRPVFAAHSTAAFALEHPSLFVALVLGIVEGLTEFLPVSSTGHLIVAGSLLGYTGERAKVFEIVIQAGAILAVCWEYRTRLVASIAGLGNNAVAQRFAMNLVVAFLPAAVLGLLFASAIKRHLFAPVPVALAFIAGAFVILWVERRQRIRS